MVAKRRVTSLILAVLLVISACMPAFAAETVPNHEGQAVGSWLGWRNTNDLVGHLETAGDIVVPREAESLFITGTADDAPLYADVNGDGESEIIFVESARVQCRDISGNLLWQTDTLQAERVYMVDDLNNDHVLEVLVIGTERVIVLKADTGETLAIQQVMGAINSGNFLVEDLDQDGCKEMFIYYYKHSYVPVFKFITDTTGKFACILANRIIDTRTENEGGIAAFTPYFITADVNNDGYKEFIMVRCYGISVYDGREISKISEGTGGSSIKEDRLMFSKAEANQIDGQPNEYPGGGYPVSNLIDGDPNTLYISDSTLDPSGKSTVIASFSKHKNLSKIVVQGYQNFEVSYYDVMRGWVSLGTNDARSTGKAEFAFGSYIFTDQIKVDVLDSNYGDPDNGKFQSQYGEIEVYGEDILAPIPATKVTSDDFQTIAATSMDGYPVENLFDSNPDTVWVSMPSDGSAEVRVDFKAEKTVSGFKTAGIASGYFEIQLWNTTESVWNTVYQSDGTSDMSMPAVIQLDEVQVTNSVRFLFQYGTANGNQSVQAADIEIWEQNPKIQVSGAAAMVGEEYPGGGYPAANLVDGNPGTYFISGKWLKDDWTNGAYGTEGFQPVVEFDIAPDTAIGEIRISACYEEVDVMIAPDGENWTAVASGGPFAGNGSINMSDNPIIVPENGKVRLLFKNGSYTNGIANADITHGSMAGTPSSGDALVCWVQLTEVEFFKPVTSAGKSIEPLDKVDYTPHLANNGRLYGHTEVKDIDGDGINEIIGLYDGVSYHMAVFENDGTGDFSLYGDQYFGYSGQQNPDDGAPGRFGGGLIPYVIGNKHSLTDADGDGVCDFIYSAYTYVPGATTGNWVTYVADSKDYDAANWKFQDIQLEGYYLHDIIFPLPDATKPVLVLSRENTISPKGTNPYELFTIENGAFQKLTQLENVAFVNKTADTTTNIAAASSRGTQEFYTPDIDHDGQNEVVVSRDGRYEFLRFQMDGSFEVVATISGELGCPTGMLTSRDGQVMLTTAASGGYMHLVTSAGQDLWTVTNGGMVSIIPTVADVDGDGYNEMIFSSDGIQAYRLLNGQFEKLWTAAGTGKSAPVTGSQAVPLMDMNGDGRPDIIAKTTDGDGRNVFVVYDGFGQEMWSYTLTNDMEGSDLGPFTVQDYIVGDVTGDQVPDIVVAAGTSYPNGRTLIIDGAEKKLCYATPVTTLIGQTNVTPWTRSTLPNPGSYSLADMDGDGVNEIYFVALEAYMKLARTEDGSFALNTMVPQIDASNCYIYYATPVIADIDGDGGLEHTLQGGFNSFSVYKGDILNAERSQHDAPAQWHFLMPPTTYNPDGSVKSRGDSDLNGSRRLQGIADVDGDGVAEIGMQFTTGVEEDQYRGYMYCFEAEGTEWTNSAADVAAKAGDYARDNKKAAVKWKYDMREQFGDNVMAWNIVTADIDGDSRAEFIVTTNTGYLVVFNGEDGLPDETVYSADGTVVQEGRVAWSMKLAGGTQLRMPVVADVDNDGYSEIIVSAGDGALHFVDGPENPVVGGDPVITGVSVQPETAIVEKGQAQQFAAIVSGTGNFDNSVEWRVDGATSANTSISATGLLTVGADEMATALIVTAVAVGDPSKGAQAVVSVIDPSGSIPSSNYYAISTSAGVGGSITPAGDVNVRKGGDKEFTITPDAGYIISDVLVDGRSVGAVASYTFENVQERHSIEVTFAKDVPSTGTDNLFADVRTNDWFFDDVMFVHQNGLMSGISDTTFSPSANATRAQLAVIFYRMDGSHAVDSEATFTDVPRNSGTAWYYDAVTWAQQNGILEGYEDGTFHPDELITREQLAVVFCNYAEYKERSTAAAGDVSAFADVQEISPWAQEAMKWAVGSGLIGGKGNGVLDPRGTATRAEVAAMLHNFSAKNGI